MQRRALTPLVTCAGTDLAITSMGTLFVAGSRQPAAGSKRRVFPLAASRRLPAEKDGDHFKGWAMPGVVLPGARTPEVAADETLDALSGHFWIFQLRDGNRFRPTTLTACMDGAVARVCSTWLGNRVGWDDEWRLPGARFRRSKHRRRAFALQRSRRRITA